MSPQWIPQNIQKRLLLYVLQQLSLFSEIDLPNLEEVSLNTIVLKDISIDPEKVGKIPGCNLRYGQVGFLELKTVSGSGIIGGGVSIIASDVEVVISPDFDVGEDVSNSVQFSLAQSTANLAHTIIFDDETIHKQTKDTSADTDEDDESDLSSPKTSSSTSSTPKPSALSGVMARAAEMALSRLQVKITNFKIKLISELTDVVLEIDEVALNSINGTRNFKISGVRLITLKPNVNPGETNSRSPSQSKPDATSKSQDSSLDESEDDDADYGDESLMDSMIFTHDEASSIYMSATSQSFAKENNPQSATTAPTILHIDEINIEFEGLTTVSNLKVDVGDVKVASVPLTPTVSSIFDGISRSLKIRRHQKRKEDFAAKHEGIRTNSKFPQYSTGNDEIDESEDPTDANEDEPEHPFFNKIHISNVIVSATSALLSDGTFVSPNSINFVFHNLNIKQKRESSVYGGVETFSVIKLTDGVPKEIFHFDQTDLSSTVNDLGNSVSSASPTPLPNSPMSPQLPTRPPSAKADIRFEIVIKSDNSQNSQEITTLMSKPAIIELDIASIMILSNFAKSLDSIQSSFTAMKTTMQTFQNNSNLKHGITSANSRQRDKGHKEEKEIESSQFVLQTASISITTTLSERSSLKTSISPISFNLLQNQLNIASILFSVITSDSEKSIGSINSIRLHTKLQEFKSFLNRYGGSGNGSTNIPRQVSMSASNTLVFNKILIQIEMEELISLVKQITKLSQNFARSSSSQSNSLENSVLFQKPYERNRKIPAMERSHFNPSRRSRAHITSNSNNMSTFMNSNRSNIASIRLQINEIEIKLLDILPDFGDICIVSREISFHEANQNINGSVHTFHAERRGKNPEDGDRFIYDYHEKSFKDVVHPLILLHAKIDEKSNSVEISLHNLLIEYYTKWLTLLNKEGPLKDTTVTSELVSQIEPFTPVDPNSSSKRFDVRISLFSAVIGLNPGRLACKSLVVIERGSFDLTFELESFYIKSSLRDISLLLIDDVANVDKSALKSQNGQSNTNFPTAVYTSPLAYFQTIGYISTGRINCTHIGVTVNTHIEAKLRRNEKLKVKDNLSLLDIKINSDEHQLELCADSTQTLLQLVNDLKLPLNFKDEEKMKVTLDEEVNLLNDVSIQFGSPTESRPRTPRQQEVDSSPEIVASDSPVELPIIDTYYDEAPSSVSTLEQDIQQLSLKTDSSGRSSLAFDEEHFTGIKPDINSKLDPVRMNINLSKITIYLYDGYDWKSTRKSIKAAVKRVEAQAQSDLDKRKKKLKKETPSKPPTRQRKVPFETIQEQDEEGSIIKSESDRETDEEGEEEEEPDEDDLYGETLFKSIHLTIPKGSNPSRLTETVNKNIRNNDHEPIHEGSESSMKTQINLDLGKNYKNLKIRRSANHKALVDLKSLEANIVVFSTRDPRKDPTDKEMEFELLNSVEVRLDDITIYDNVPTSSWNKFLSYMNSLGKREIGTSMLKLSLTNVRPAPQLVSSETIAKLSVLPLRLHIDQDTLDFMTRFFGFKDARFDLPIDEIVYLQRFQIAPLKLKLDYKPKKIDYVGMRSGNTAEFMNFFILDGSDIVLEKVILHGVHGFEKLGDALGSAWGPSIQQTQLVGILAGLSPLRSIVNIGGGVKDLIAIPISEYKKDGRLIRSLQKGTSAFARTAGYEIINLGAKLASGTQVLLEQGEEMFGGEGASARLPARYRKESTKKKVDEDTQNTVAKGPVKNKKDLFASSQLLHQNVKIDKDQYGSRKLYSYVEMDDDDDDSSAFDNELLSKSIFLLDTPTAKHQGKKNKSRKNTNPNGSDSEEEFAEIDDDEENEKIVSLYSNQPETIKQGIKSAYKSIGKNLSSTKKTIINLKNEVNESDNFQDSVVSVLKTSPIILIRPMIGTTEALSRALMGLSNEIDSKRIIESKDKYRYNGKKATGGGGRDGGSDDDEEVEQAKSSRTQKNSKSSKYVDDEDDDDYDYFKDV